MITLYQYPPAYDVPTSVSPYCTKVELYLRLTDRDYETALGSNLKSPNKAVPYVRWPDGEVSAESDAIIERLEKQGPSLDEGLASADSTRGHELVGLAQGVLYYGCLHSRFGEPDCWPIQKQTIRKLVPALLAPIAAPIIRHLQVKKCRANGVGGEHGYGKVEDAINQLAEALGDKPYMLGEGPRTADCAVWANLLGCAATTVDSPVRRAARGNERLMAYVARLAKDAKFDLPAWR
jgi:glutathione S-transferase